MRDCGTLALEPDEQVTLRDRERRRVRRGAQGLGLLCHALAQRPAGVLRAARRADPQHADGPLFRAAGRARTRGRIRRLHGAGKPGGGGLARRHRRRSTPCARASETPLERRSAADAALPLRGPPSEPRPSSTTRRRRARSASTCRRRNTRVPTTAAACAGTGSRRHAIDLAALYERGYVDATYGGPAGMRARLEQHAGAAARALRQCRPGGAHPRIRRTRDSGQRRRGRRLLDVGAGIGVFPAADEGRRLDRDRRRA